MDEIFVDPFGVRYNLRYRHNGAATFVNNDCGKKIYAYLLNGQLHCEGGQAIQYLSKTYHYGFKFEHGKFLGVDGFLSEIIEHGVHTMDMISKMDNMVSWMWVRHYRRFR